MTMKLLALGDPHGTEPNIHYDGFEAIAVTGDFCAGDEIRPYIFQALRDGAPGLGVQWYDIVGRAEAEKMVERSLEGGRKSLEKIDSLGKPAYIVPGNWDWVGSKDENANIFERDHYTSLVEGLDNIIDVNLRRTGCGEEYEIIGYGISTGPEDPRLNGCSDTTEYCNYLDRFGRLFENAKKPVIFLSHNVPYGTSLDEIKDRSFPGYGQHFGSTVVWDMIFRHQPVVSIGGHMHENPGTCKLGKTIAINAGTGADANIFIELSGNRATKIEFYHG